MEKARGKPKPKLRRVERGIFEYRCTDGTHYYCVEFRDPKNPKRRIRERVEVEPGGRATLTEARAHRTKRDHERRTGTYEHPDDRELREEAERLQAAAEVGLTFDEFTKRFLDDYGKQRKSTYYADVLSPTRPLRVYFAGRYIRQIQSADLDAYRVHRSTIERRGKKAGDSTVRKDLTALGTMFKQAKRWKLIDVNPALDLEKPPEPPPRGRALTNEEWTKLLKELRPTHRALAVFTVATGTRLQEAAGLRWTDVDLRGGFVRFSDENSKTARSKRVKLGAAAKHVLAELDCVRREVARATEKLPEFVFVNADGTDLSSKRERNRVSQMFRAAATTAEVAWASFKSLRTTAATWAEEEGVPVGETKALMGHADVQTTQRFYIRTDADRTANVVSALDRRLGFEETEDGRNGDSMETGPGSFSEGTATGA